MPNEQIPPKHQGLCDGIILSKSFTHCQFIQHFLHLFRHSFVLVWLRSQLWYRKMIAYGSKEVAFTDEQNSQPLRSFFRTKRPGDAGLCNDLTALIHLTLRCLNWINYRLMRFPDYVTYSTAAINAHNVIPRSR